MYVSTQLQEASWALGGVAPERLGHNFLLTWPMFAHSTYHFTTVPASKGHANPFFTYPNRRLRADFDQIGVPPLGPWDLGRALGELLDPQGAQVSPR